MAQKGQQASAAPTASSTGFCITEGCKKSAERAEFCTEHFSWFKIGLITKRGAKAKDFEKKMGQIGRTADKTA